MNLAVLAFALLFTAHEVGPPAGVLRGQVRSEGTGAPLAYATVEILDTPEEFRAVTDSAGEYVLRRVPAGRHIIRASQLDHAPFEVEVLVPAGGELVVDLTLAVRPVALPAVMARAQPRPDEDTVAARTSELGAANIRVLEATPGVAELGLAEAARIVPGGQPGDASDILYVRGGAVDLKLVLLDGAPVYAPFHVGGLVSAFEPDLLSSAKLYLGGAPARYDGALSYVLDMETRAGRRDAPHASASVDLLTARGIADGPISRHASYLVGARGVHGLGTEPIVAGPFPYSYADAVARVDGDLGPEAAISATGFWNRESIRLDRVGSAPAHARWGNTAGSVRYRGPLAGIDAELTAAFGDYRARLPLGGPQPLMTDGISQRMRLTADMSEDLGVGKLFYGASYDRLWIRYLGWNRYAPGDSMVLDTEAGGTSFGGYVDADWHPFARVRLRGGVRADVFAGERAPRLGPRLSVTLLLSDRAALTLAGGQYHQYVRASEASLVNADSGGRPVRPLSVARASHLVVSLDQELVEGMRLGLDGFYKNYEGVVAVQGSDRTESHASGVDLWLRRSTGRITGWLGYSLAWIWSVEDRAPVTDLFSGRQLLSAGLAGPIAWSTHFDVKVGYGAGLPYTAVPQNAAPSTSLRPMGPRLEVASDAVETVPATAPILDQPYLRVDAEIARTFVGQLRGVDFELTPYVRVLNALDRRDALFYQLDRTRDREPRALAALPVLPVVGVSWRF